MFDITIEDLSGSMEIMAFEKVLVTGGSYFQIDQPVLVYGRVSAREDEVLLIDQPKAAKKTVAEKSSAALRSMSVSPEVDLRGMMVDEALLAMERYLDSAVMAKLKTVTIIQGKGTGALRQAVQNELKRNRYVKSYRLGRYGEGEMGVTVVELK